MDDSSDKLRATLKELEAELSAADSLDDETREQLADAVSAIAASIRRGKRSDEAPTPRATATSSSSAHSNRERTSMCFSTPMRRYYAVRAACRRSSSPEEPPPMRDPGFNASLASR